MKKIKLLLLTLFAPVLLFANNSKEEAINTQEVECYIIYFYCDGGEDPTGSEMHCWFKGTMDNDTWNTIITQAIERNCGPNDEEEDDDGGEL